MKYAAALLLGLASVQATYVGEYSGYFYGSASTYNTMYATTWDVEYGTYYATAQDATTPWDHYEYYGVYADAYYTVQVTNTNDMWYVADIYSTFYPFWVIPAELQINWDRMVSNPTYNYAVNWYYYLAYLDTYYDEYANVATVSIGNFLYSTGSPLPVAANWALTTTAAETADPIYTFSLWDKINSQFLGGSSPLLGSDSGVYTTGTMFTL